jgi:hypothetical protein
MSSQIKDILERAIATYIQTFLGLLTAGGLGVDTGLSTIKIAALGGLPAAFSVIKSALATYAPIGDATGSVLRQQAVIPEDAEEQLYN